MIIMDNTNKVAYWNPFDKEDFDEYTDEYGDWIKCSLCGEPDAIDYNYFISHGIPQPNESNYCPNCNAKMLGRK